jgi:hypothetical protein
MQIDSDDFGGSRQPCSLDCIESNGAAAEDHDALAFLHPGDIHGRAETGHHAAADNAGARKRHGGWQWCDRLLPHQSQAGERADIERAIDRLTAPRCPLRVGMAEASLQNVGGLAEFAKDSIAPLALVAFPARNRPIEHHAITGTHVHQSLAYLPDHARALMPHHQRTLPRE